ncbi:MAG TPA: type II toxin-antitoxin system RatA family toxin [Crenotrichaceae bacterium]|nr:type II toxin-antitoxin system RatA family toxin [Crenotrichaceae bacterium]
MTSIERSALVRFSAQQMYDLVADIAAYPEFLPWCQSSRILSGVDSVVEAELEIARGGFHKSFSTRNVNIEPDEIKMTLLNGPFTALQGSWLFTPLNNNASKIILKLEFELAGGVAAVAFGRIFNQICETMVDAFHQRAIVLYGTTSNSD